jgi:hypothetical protein
MIRITIELDPRNGKLTVNGPIHDKVLMYGALRLAEDVVREYEHNEAMRRVLPVAAMPANLQG